MTAAVVATMSVSLDELTESLETIQATVRTCSAALKAQSADKDIDFAKTLDDKVSKRLKALVRDANDLQRRMISLMVHVSNESSAATKAFNRALARKLQAQSTHS